jgi:hypothetical protein
MSNMNVLFFAEMALFSGVVIGFGLYEIWKLTPEQSAKEDAKALARAEKYKLEEAARHSKR